VRSSDSTTTIRVNEVIITRIDGASDSTVSNAISWMTRSVRPVPWPKLMLCLGLARYAEKQRYRHPRRETDARRRTSLSSSLSRFVQKACHFLLEIVRLRGGLPRSS